MILTVPRVFRLARSRRISAQGEREGDLRPGQMISEKRLLRQRSIGNAFFLQLAGMKSTQMQNFYGSIVKYSYQSAS